MCAVDRMLMQECNGGLDEPHVRAEKRPKSDRSWFPQRHAERRGRGLSQYLGDLCRLW
jgi:hypothetical protein